MMPYSDLIAIERPGIITSKMGVTDRSSYMPASVFADTAWPAANAACYVKLFNPEEFRVTHMWYLAGTTASGNVDLGIFDDFGTKLGSTGSTAISAGPLAKIIALTAPLIVPVGEVILGLAIDNGTAQFQREDVSIFGTHFDRLWGFAEEAAAFALPSAATPVALTNFQTGPPIFGAVDLVY